VGSWEEEVGGWQEGQENETRRTILTIKPVFDVEFNDGVQMQRKKKKIENGDLRLIALTLY
jgi:hypothetical protein